MPLYEYTCRACGKGCELLVRGDDTPVCPHCESKKLDKRLSVVAGHVAGTRGTAPVPGNCGRPQCGTGGCQGIG